MNLDLDAIYRAWDKVDGSMISTVRLPDGSFMLKSKGSLFSDQATAANKLVRTQEYAPLYMYLDEMVSRGATVIMEYVAPSNRIVIGYREPALVILAIREIETGDEWELPNIPKFTVDTFNIDYYPTIEEFIAAIPDMTGIEGFVIQLESGMRVKIKTEWYMALHHLKDSINHPRRLFEAVLQETSDDLRASFYDDPLALELIVEMEAKVAAIYKEMVSSVENFYLTNRGLDRKEYAILGQEQLIRSHFSLAMNLYLGRENDYKAFMVKHYRDYGITDDVDEEIP